MLASHVWRPGQKPYAELTLADIIVTYQHFTQDNLMRTFKFVGELPLSNGNLLLISLAVLYTYAAQDVLLCFNNHSSNVLACISS